MRICASRVGAVLLLSSILVPSPANGQSLVSRLGALLTEQRPEETFVPDVAAAEATAATVAGLFHVELVTVPVAASSGGFVYRLNPQLGLVERASDSFGPFFTEPVLRNSRGQLSLGLGYQSAEFTSLQGASLQAGTFPTNAARQDGSLQPFSVDTLRLEISARTTVPFASYGLTDRLAVGAAVPITTVRFSGRRVRTVNGSSSLQSLQSGSATGLGDISVNARYLVWGGGGVRGVSIGTDLRLPTGREEDLLGAGKAALRLFGIGSWEDGQLAVHVNGGFGVGGISRELFWSTATTFAVVPRVTLVGEVMGRRTSELAEVQDVYQPHPLMPGVETMRWLTADTGTVTTFIVAGAKWNIVRSWLVNTSLLIRVTDAGLRDRVTPSVSLNYAF